MAPDETPPPTVSGNPAEGAGHPPPAALAPVDKDERVLAMVAYFLTFITGIIILLVAKKEQRYARWHAIQAIGLGIVYVILQILVNIATAPFRLGFGFGWYPWGDFGGVVGLLLLVGIIVLAVKTYQGQTIRLPVLADLADKNA